MKELQVRNRQRARRVDSRLLRSIGVELLEHLLKIEAYELGVSLVSARAMADLNERFLQHEGATDVITFDLGEGAFAGEIYICLAVAERQAAEFKTTWQSEVVRYLVHGVLHLQDYDDLDPEKRRVMKREENRLVKALARRFDFAPLGT